MEKSIFNISIFSLLVLWNVNLMGQDTYSKFFDARPGMWCRWQNMLVEDESLIVSATFSGDTSIVSSLIRFDLFGDSIDSKQYSDFVLGLEQSLIKLDDGYDLIGNLWSKDEKNARGNMLVHLDGSLQVLSMEELFYKEYTSVNTRGLQLGTNEKRVYFETIDNTPIVDTKSHILILDVENDTIKHNIEFGSPFAEKYTDYNLSVLQETPDGELLFMATPQFVGEAGSLFEIMKISRSGEVLSRIVGPQSVDNNAMALDEKGDIYFFTKSIPYELNAEYSEIDGFGGISKVNADMDSVLWSRPLGFSADPFDLDRRVHLSRGMRRLSDNNLIAYGSARHFTDPAKFGFITKFNSDGDIIWSRFYRPQLSEDDFRASSIEQCEELPDGRIICMGISNNTTNNNPEGNELWLLMLDSEGCLEPGCERENILTSTSSKLPTQSGRIYPNPVTDILQVADVSFDSYVISDMMGRKVLEGSFDTEINLPTSIPSGMYILQLVEGQRLKAVFKFFRE